jgi:hypothetical protein
MWRAAMRRESDVDAARTFRVPILISDERSSSSAKGKCLPRKNGGMWW